MVLFLSSMQTDVDCLEHYDWYIRYTELLAKKKVSTNQRMSAVAQMKRLVKDASHQCSERSRRKREARLHMAEEQRR